VANSNCGSVAAVVYPIDTEILGHFCNGAATPGPLHTPDAPAGEEDPNAASPVIKALAELVKQELDEWGDCTLPSTGCRVLSVSDHLDFFLSFSGFGSRGFSSTKSLPRMSSSVSSARLAAGEPGMNSSGRQQFSAKTPGGLFRIYPGRIRQA
jgi:hypothetical protein